MVQQRLPSLMTAISNAEIDESVVEKLAALVAVLGNAAAAELMTTLHADGLKAGQQQGTNVWRAIKLLVELSS